MREKIQSLRGPPIPLCPLVSFRTPFARRCITLCIFVYVLQTWTRARRRRSRRCWCPTTGTCWWRTLVTANPRSSAAPVLARATRSHTVNPLPVPVAPHAALHAHTTPREHVAKRFGETHGCGGCIVLVYSTLLWVCRRGYHRGFTLSCGLTMILSEFWVDHCLLEAVPPSALTVVGAPPENFRRL